MDKKTYKLIIWGSIIFFALLVFFNHLLLNFDIDIFENKVLFTIIKIYLFVMIFNYFKDIFLTEIREKTINNLQKLKLKIKYAKYLMYFSTIFALFFSLVAIFFVEYYYYFIYEPYDNILLITVFYLLFQLMFYAYIWMFFTTVIFFKIARIYSSIAEQEF